MGGAWAIEWRSENKLDGKRSFLLGSGYSKRRDMVPPEFAGCPLLIFADRKTTRDYIREHWGFIATRPDLKAEPHGWKVPRPIRVGARVLPT